MTTEPLREMVISQADHCNGRITSTSLLPIICPGPGGLPLCSSTLSGREPSLRRTCRGMYGAHRSQCLACFTACWTRTTNQRQERLEIFAGSGVLYGHITEVSLTDYILAWRVPKNRMVGSRVGDLG